MERREFLNRTALRALLSLTLLLVPVGLAAAADLTTAKVIVFPGGQNLPLFVGQEKGFFAREKLEIALTPTPNSVFQMTNMIAGKFDIAITSPDNVIAYNEGQGAVSVEGTPDLFAFMGGNHLFLTLAVQPEITSYADLKGKELSVDALTTGFAFVLRKMLAVKGLGEGDYRLASAGGTLQRWEALKEKKHAGTLLNAPFNLIAAASGFRALGSANDTLGAYEAIVGAARRSWAREHRAQVVGFIRGYVAAQEWLFNPANRAEAIQILLKRVPQISPDLAGKTYDLFFTPGSGIDPKAALNVEGLLTVLKLRSEYARPRKELTDPVKYYDLTYYNEALSRR